MTDRVPSRSHWQWPLIVVALLLMQLGVCAAIIYFAVSDPTFAVESNYHDKALRWDEQQRKRWASEALGWQAKVSVDRSADPLGRRQISVSIRDRAGKLIEGADVELEGFAHSRARQRQRWVLMPRDAGVYGAAAILHRTGQWEFQVTAVRDDEIFHATELTFVWQASQRGAQELHRSTTSKTP